MRPDELERLTESRLAGLPAPRAPHTLLPRVMAAVALAARPWYRRSWFTWPAAWQTLSAAALVAVVIAAALVAPSVQNTVGGEVSGVVAPVAAPLTQAISRVDAWSIAAGVVWRVVQPAVGVLLVLVLMMCAACAAFGAALRRVAFGGALRL